MKLFIPFIAMVLMITLLITYILADNFVPAIVCMLGFAYFSKRCDAEYARRQPKPTVIVCSACRLASGLVVCGVRHFDRFMRDQIEAAGETHVGAEQGFVNALGEFMTREEAYNLARRNGQRKYRCGGDKSQLFSENLY